MTASKIPFYRPSFSDAQRSAIARSMDEILTSGLLMLGPYLAGLERTFSTLAGTTHAIGLNSATTALQIALTKFDVRDHEVLVPAAAFLTDASAVIFAGGRPVLVDIDPETLSFDLEDLERKLTPMTKGVIWVHLAGFIAENWRDIVRWAKDRGLFLIEDASHAHGATVAGRAAGSLGDVGVFSFYPTKVVTAGTGGMMTTNDVEIATFAREMRVFGKSASGEILHIGNDWFLDEIRACVGFHHASALDRQLARRRDLAARYGAGLANQYGLRLFPVAADQAPSWYHYPIILPDQARLEAVSRALMTEDGIATKVIYKPIHEETAFRFLNQGGLLGAETALGRTLCLPMFVDMTDEEVDRVCDAVRLRCRDAS